MQKKFHVIHGPGLRSYDYLFSGFAYNQPGLTAAFRNSATSLLVDKRKDPAVALLHTGHGVDFLSGDIESSSLALIFNYVYPKNPKAYQHQCLSLSSLEAAKRMKSKFGNRFHIFKRIAYALSIQRFEEKTADLGEPPKPYTLKRLDEMLARRISHEIDPEFSRYWPKTQDFVKQGIGFGLIDHRQIVSIAWSAFPLNEFMEVAVSTHPQFRGQGLCRYPERTLLQYAFDHKITPVCDTLEKNRSARRLAEKNGWQPEASHYWALHTPWNAKRKTFEIDPQCLDFYTGDYSLGIQRIRIFAKDKKLFMGFQHSPHMELELAAESSCHFFLVQVDGQITFQLGSEKKASGLVFRQMGRHLLAERLA